MGFHLLEIQALADNESSVNMVGLDPISSSQLSMEEIHRCEHDPKARLIMRPVVDVGNCIG